MNKKTIQELKERLEKRKSKIEGELQNFAKEDKEVKGDWDTTYPESAGGAGGQALEDAADQVEEYANLLPVEHSLELQLQDINSALEKIKEGKYGKCEKCKKNIREERLKVHPEAKLCSGCQS